MLGAQHHMRGCPYPYFFVIFYLFGPSLSYIRASIASFVMWGFASWIRGSDPAIFEPLSQETVTGYLYKLFGLIIMYVEFHLSISLMNAQPVV